jgi:hypothetical protein
MRACAPDPGIFDFQLEDRIQCKHKQLRQLRVYCAREGVGCPGPCISYSDAQGTVV